LVRQCNGNEAPLQRYRPSRGRTENEAGNITTLDFHWQLDLWTRQTNAVDGPEPASQKHVPGVLDPKHWALGRCRRIPTGAQMQEVDELLAHGSGHVFLVCTRGNHFGHRVQEAEMLGFLRRRLAMAAAPHRELGDGDPDHEEADSGLKIRTMGDGQAAVGLGEEDIEGQRRADGSQIARDPDHRAPTLPRSRR
jgi:hypothetical protein